MTATTYKSNRNLRSFVYRCDVPAKVLADQFAHLSEEDASDYFFCYRGYWYHTSDFMHAPAGMFEGAPFRVHGYLSDSAFSGVIIFLSSDCESYRVATVFS